MTRLTVAAEDDETEVLGKLAGDLQEDIDIDENEIGGTLKYVTGYTGFDPSHADLQEGNYLALKFDDEEDATTTVELVGGESGPVELDSDKNCVFRITDTSMTIRVVSSKSGKSDNIKVFKLDRLTLEQPTE